MIWFAISVIALLGAFALVVRFARTARNFFLLGALASAGAGIAIAATLAISPWSNVFTWAESNAVVLAIVLAMTALLMAFVARHPAQR